MKYSWEYKLKCVEDYKNKGKWPKDAKSSLKSKIIYWIRIYDIYGIDGLKHKSQNKVWTAEERFELVAQVLAGNSIKSTAINAGTSDGLLYQWVRKYKQFGYDGLKLSKGRKPKDPNMSKDNEPKELTKSEREELKILRKQNEFLRTENAYLKKLRALIVQKQVESSVKAKKQRSSENSENQEIN